jgi:hypothetical protein
MSHGFVLDDSVAEKNLMRLVAEFKIFAKKGNTIRGSRLTFFIINF